jgi:hypothetical protein
MFRPLLRSLVISAITFSAAAEERPASFINDVMPVLTKAGCNTGACHAKAIIGQNGFRLSLFGYEPAEDYEHIVKEGRGRRVFADAPEQSLLLLKSANLSPHGGGRKLAPDSDGFKTIARWISEGMPFQVKNDPTIASLKISPQNDTLPVRSERQLTVTASYSDGSSRDVTRLAVYEPNDKAMAEVSESGRVTFFDLPGNAAVMVRYQGLVGVYTAALPQGAPVPAVPASKNFIDDLVFSNLKRLGIPPSPLCDDATFIRRASLDIAGKIPSTEETTAFLADTRPDKRNRLVDSLLSSPEYADFFANKWAAVLRNKRIDKGTKASFAFHSWLRDGLLANKPYDQMVRELLAATGDAVSNPPVAWYNQVKTPEQQLEDVSQLFLGVRMGCAQCHHHPFERWSQQDYYGLAAFFTQVGRRPTATAGQSLIFHKRGVAKAENKRTGQLVQPAGLGSPTLTIAPDDDPRIHLADWIGASNNPFFAKALANRYWKHFFNRGLVEPEDDMRDTNPPTNPELLNALANHFVQQKFDLKAVIRAITTSNAYQLSATATSDNASDRQNFSHYYPRRLNAEVLLDSIDQITRSATNYSDLPAGTRAIALPDNSYNKASLFLTVFGRPEGDSVCECERVQAPSLGQSLHLMNAPEMRAKLSGSDATAARMAKAKDDDASLRDLYLAAFSREPREPEVAVAKEHLTKERLSADGKPLDTNLSRKMAYEDLIWALINSKEFLFNH